MKKMLIAELVLLASVLLSACSQSAPKPILETPIPTNETGIQEPANATDIQEPAKQGISSGNFLNKGYLVQSEGDPYYYYACNRRTQDGKNGI